MEANETEVRAEDGRAFAARNPVLIRDLTLNDLTRHILGAAIEVHRILGPGLLESVYRRCLCIELGLRNIAHASERRIPIVYKDISLPDHLRLDLIVQNRVVVETKAVESLAGIHQSQMLTYLKLTGCPAGLLINFNVPRLMDGVKRLINPAALDR